MIPWKIQAVLDKDYDHETPDKPRSIEFAGAVKTWVNGAVKRYGGKVVGDIKGWREASGFIQWAGGKYTYFCIPFDSDEFLIRAAKSPKDFTGGTNQYCQFHNFDPLARRVAEGA